MVLVSEWLKVADCESVYGGFDSPQAPKGNGTNQIFNTVGTGRRERGGIGYKEVTLCTPAGRSEWYSEVILLITQMSSILSIGT